MSKGNLGSGLGLRVCPGSTRDPDVSGPGNCSGLVFVAAFTSTPLACRSCLHWLQTQTWQRTTGKSIPAGRDFEDSRIPIACLLFGTCSQLATVLRQTRNMLPSFSCDPTTIKGNPKTEPNVLEFSSRIPLDHRVSRQVSGSVLLFGGHPSHTTCIVLGAVGSKSFNVLATTLNVARVSENV